jgi:hypothetical protein
MTPVIIQSPKRYIYVVVVHNSENHTIYFCTASQDNALNFSDERNGKVYRVSVDKQDDEHDALMKFDKEGGEHVYG